MRESRKICTNLFFPIEYRHVQEEKGINNDGNMIV